MLLVGGPFGCCRAFRAVVDWCCSCRWGWLLKELRLGVGRWTGNVGFRRFAVGVCLVVRFQRDSVAVLPRVNGGVLGVPVVAVEIGYRGEVGGSP